MGFSYAYNLPFSRRFSSLRGRFVRGKPGFRIVRNHNKLISLLFAQLSADGRNILTKTQIGCLLAPFATNK